MSQIGVVSALPLEGRCLRGRCRPPRPGEVVALSAAAVLGVAGPGCARARRMAERLAEQRVTGLVSWGLAGGLEPGMAPGTLTAANEVVTTTGIGYLTDDAWRQSVLAALPSQVLSTEARLLASDTVITTSQDKASLRRRYTASAVDMESGAIACVATRHRLPLLVLRVVVDPADTALPPPLASAVDERGGLRLSYLAGLLARRPSQLWPLLQLAGNSRAATSTLRRIAPMVTSDGAWRAAAPQRRVSTPP